MRKFCYFPHVFNGLIMPANRIIRLLLVAAMFALFPPTVSAVMITVQVGDGLGGRVTSSPAKMGCQQSCTIQTFSDSGLSLFAVPDEGYRFQGWEGACANTIGPLCTIKPTGDGNVSVRFAKTKTKATNVATKALLLLHGKGDKYSVWNTFVKQHFNNRCPVVYGGVVLDEDSVGPHNKVYCYRIAFGYYDLLNLSNPAGIIGLADSQNDRDNLSSKHLSNEVAAAVLGILNRHPKLSLTLVGQGHVASAAQVFSQANTAVRGDVVGLLDLQQRDASVTDVDVGGLENTTFEDDQTACLSLDAHPSQGGKISAALAQLTKSWWLAR